MARAGANEVLTYSFVHERTISSAGQDSSDAYRLSNALSPDLQFYRLSLTPSLLDKIHANIKAGHDEFSLFELGKRHSKSAGLDDQGLPVEPPVLALVYANKDDGTGAAFYRVKSILEFLAGQLKIELVYEQLDSASTSPVVMPFEPKRSAIVTDKSTGQYVGVVGEYKKSVAKNFKLPNYAAGFEIDTETVLRLTEQASATYRPLSRFPKVDRDISLRVPLTMEYARVHSELESALRQTGLEFSVELVGIYHPENTDTKNLTFRISLTSHEKTLTSLEVNEMIEGVTQYLLRSTGAEVV